MNMEKMMQDKAVSMYGSDLSNCSNEQIYLLLLDITKDLMANAPLIEGDRKLYYISAEFLIGKLLSNNLLNLGVYDQVRDVLAGMGKTLAEIEEIEPEPSLGNGGLGRLAACFLDSIATLELPGDGVGLNYHLGLFHQKFENRKQKELPDPWMTAQSWLNDTGKYYPVHFGNMDVEAHLKSMDVIGYTGKKNQLLLFDLDTVTEAIVESDSINFDKNDVKENLTLFLYPDDSDEVGRKLRVYQQYFLVSAGAQMILEDVKAHSWDLKNISDHVVIQINDTHPSMVIPELIRLLMENGLSLEEAVAQTEKVCAYTNHTILAEALEKWPSHFIEQVAPQLMPIIRELDAIAAKRDDNPKTRIIQNDIIHMANMDIHFSKSTNGVAKIHTDILKDTELHDFYRLYPEKFNNKTNGITFRRWLQACNPQLTKWIISKIGDGFLKDSMELEALKKYAADPECQKEVLAIKREKKEELAVFLKNRQGVEIDPNSIFDIQVKRLHEYKRQQMNLLSVINLYQEIKNGYVPEEKVTVIFGAKAAPAYILAKDIIHAILVLSDLIVKDEVASKYLQVVMVENYDVTCAEKLIPAADISEQISLASKEASGTSNMKFMLNGAVTLGTDDGANVEIHHLVGDDNIFIFGVDSDTVIKHYEKADYHPQDILAQDSKVRELVDFLVSEEMIALGDQTSLGRLHHDITTKDWFMALIDLESYMNCRKEAYAAYADQNRWAQMMINNIAAAGFFSSDRTIAQYNEEIWKLK